TLGLSAGANRWENKTGGTRSKRNLRRVRHHEKGRRGGSRLAPLPIDTIKVGFSSLVKTINGSLLSLGQKIVDARMAPLIFGPRFRRCLRACGGDPARTAPRRRERGQRVVQLR